MAGLCDDIERFILQLLREQQQVELQRNDLAARFSCAPSQINYVLSTRFSPEHGYRVESRRGGGGFVRVIRIDVKRVQVLQTLADRVGEEIEYEPAVQILTKLCKLEILSLPQARLMCAAMTEEAIGGDADAPRRRAGILQSMLRCASKEACVDVM